MAECTEFNFLAKTRTLFFVFLLIFLLFTQDIIIPDNINKSFFVIPSLHCSWIPSLNPFRFLPEGVLSGIVIIPTEANFFVISTILGTSIQIWCVFVK